jgi:hypothetical protein
MRKYLLDDEVVIATMKNKDGALYSTKSLNMNHELVGGYIQNIITCEVVCDLTPEEVLAFWGKEEFLYE